MYPKKLTPDDIAMLRVCHEAGPISAMEMVGEFLPFVKAGLIGPDGLLTENGLFCLALEDTP